MNQILYVEKPKKGNSLEINSIVKIFTIVILILGIILIVKGTYGVINGSTDAQGKNDIIVSIKEVNDKLELNIKHDKAIDKIVYSWNGEQEKTLQGKGQADLIEQIELPLGTNVLSLKIIDKNKKKFEYTKELFRAEKDTIDPQIEFVVEGSKVKMVIKDETELSYIMYRWNEEDNTVVEPREDSKKQIEEKITILKGENTLTIVAVDAAGNETIKQQTFRGVKKPKIETTQENDELVIKITDEENIKKIELNVNGEIFSTDPDETGVSINMKEVELRQKLVSGQNTITITVFSVNGLSEQVTKQITL